MFQRPPMTSSPIPPPSNPTAIRGRRRGRLRRAGEREIHALQKDRLSFPIRCYRVPFECLCVSRDKYPPTLSPPQQACGVLRRIGRRGVRELFSRNEPSVVVATDESWFAEYEVDEGVEGVHVPTLPKFRVDVLVVWARTEKTEARVPRECGGSVNVTK